MFVPKPVLLALFLRKVVPLAALAIVVTATVCVLAFR